MSGASHEFRERLLKAEQATPALRERYEKEMQAMLEKKLTGVRRWVWLGAAAMGVGFTGLFGTLAVVAPAGFPWWGRLIFAAGALFGIGWAILAIRIFRRGSLNLKTDTGAATGMAWGLPILRMIVSGLVFLVMGAAFLMRHVVELSELKTREKLLEIEYRLAELSEAVTRGLKS